MTSLISSPEISQPVSALPACGYFDDPKMQERLLFHASKLIGTPFVPHAMIPGAGMDCIHLNAWVYLQTGFLKTFKAPQYTLDAGKHLERSALIDWLETSGRFFRLGGSGNLPESAGNLPAQIQPGDTLCFRFRARVEHHVGLAIGAKTFLHCLQRRTVEKADWSHPPYKQMLTAVYRPRL